ncbi:unnamed protein product [Rotaria sordida]|uniref:NFACT protein C-terminal domain-containing protein n=1 Tax=Rotaria sordida TaxID=392033 RepID=A0A815AQB1_9BILA|nr:unnamed protein product [Rotaria sordida]CAF1537917.1 unnamed protein product [Rotaria sordida]
MELIENLLSVGEAASTMECFRPENSQIQYEQYYASANDQSRVRLPRLMTFQTSLNSFGDQSSYRCKMYVGFSSQFKDCTYNKIQYRPQSASVAIAIIDEDEEEKAKRLSQDPRLLFTLTGQPTTDDPLTNVVGVHAPWVTLNNYKYNVKVLPGSFGKKGKNVQPAS